MTGSAWLMLIITWTVVTFFTVKFFLAVLRTPPRDEDSTATRSEHPPA